MGKYTTRLETIIQIIVKDNYKEIINNHDDRIKLARPFIFNFDYELFDSSHKEELETKILRYYYMYEIGHETYNLWHFEFQTLFTNLLDHYNQLYKAESLDFNPLINYSLNESQTRLSKGNVESNSNSQNNQSSKDRTVFNDTPQSKISLDENEDYATSITFNDSNSDSNTKDNTNQKSNATENLGRNVEGLTGNSYNNLLREYENSIRNIDLEFIQDLRELFLIIW